MTENIQDIIDGYLKLYPAEKRKLALLIEQLSDHEDHRTGPSCCSPNTHSSVSGSSQAGIGTDPMRIRSPPPKEKSGRKPDLPTSYSSFRMTTVSSRSISAHTISRPGQNVTNQRTSTTTSGTFLPPAIQNSKRLTVSSTAVSGYPSPIGVSVTYAKSSVKCKPQTCFKLF